MAASITEELLQQGPAPLSTTVAPAGTMPPPTSQESTPATTGDLAVAQMEVESGGNPNAVSPKGAIGLMQIMPATGRMFGVTPEQLKDPVINRRVRDQYYNQLLQRYNGDNEKALMAYDAGPGRVDSGQVPQESRDYAAKVLGRAGMAPPFSPPASPSLTDELLGYAREDDAAAQQRQNAQITSAVQGPSHIEGPSLTDELMDAVRPVGRDIALAAGPAPVGAIYDPGATQAVPGAQPAPISPGMPPEAARGIRQAVLSPGKASALDFIKQTGAFIPGGQALANLPEAFHEYSKIQAAHPHAVNAAIAIGAAASEFATMGADTPLTALMYSIMAHDAVYEASEYAGDTATGLIDKHLTPNHPLIGWMAGLGVGAAAAIGGEHAIDASMWEKYLPKVGGPAADAIRAATIAKMPEEARETVLKNHPELTGQVESLLERAKNLDTAGRAPVVDLTPQEAVDVHPVKKAIAKTAPAPGTVARIDQTNQGQQDYREGAEAAAARREAAAAPGATTKVEPAPKDSPEVLVRKALNAAIKANGKSHTAVSINGATAVSGGNGKFLSVGKDLYDPKGVKIASYPSPTEAKGIANLRNKSLATPKTVEEIKAEKPRFEVREDRYGGFNLYDNKAAKEVGGGPNEAKVRAEAAKLNRKEIRATTKVGSDLQPQPDGTIKPVPGLTIKPADKPGQTATINGKPAPIPSLTNPNPLTPSNVAVVNDTLAKAAATSPGKGYTDLGAQIPFITPIVSSFMEHTVAPATRAMLDFTKEMPGTIKNFFNPASRDIHSMNAADLVNAANSEMGVANIRIADGIHQWQGTMARDIGDWRRANPSKDAMDLSNPGMDFATRMDEGLPQATPAAQALADSMKDGLEGPGGTVQEIRRLDPKALQNLYDNYFPRIFDRTVDGKMMDADQFMAYIRSKTSSLQGHSGFMKRRKLNPVTGEPFTLRELVTPTSQGGLGLRLISDNPVDMYIAKQHEMTKWIMAHRVKAALAQHGEAIAVPTGQVSPKDLAKNNMMTEQQAKLMGLVPGTDRVFKGWHDAPAGIRVGFKAPDGKTKWVTSKRLPVQWFIHPSADTVFNNFTSKGLGDMSKWGQTSHNWFRDFFRPLSNQMNEIQMFLPTFHLILEAKHAVGTDMSIGLKNLMDIPEDLWHGDYSEAMRQVVKGTKWSIPNPFAPITNMVDGRRLMDVMTQQKDSKWWSPERAEFVRNATEGGFDWTRGAQFQTHQYEAMARAYQYGDWLGAGGHAIFAGIEALGRVMFQRVVPWMKLGALHKLSVDALQKLPHTATDMERLHTLQNLNKSVDNYFGELNYDQLNMPRWMRDAMFIAQRSPGWNLGTLRMWFNGGKDTIKLASRVLSGGKLNPNAHVTYDMAQVVGDHLVSLGIAAIGTMYFTGHLPHLEPSRPGAQQGPKEIFEKFRADYRDAFSIHTGQKDRYGNEIMIMPPGYAKDALNYMTDPETTQENKMSAPIQTIREIRANRDYYGDRIYNEGDSLLTKNMKVGKAEYPFPFQFSNYAKAKTQPDTYGGGKPVIFGQTAPELLALGGASKVSLAASSNPGDRLMMQITAKNEGMNPADRDRFALRQKIEDNYRRTGKVPNLGQLVYQDKLNPGDVSQIRKDLHTSPWAARFNSMQDMHDRLDVAQAYVAGGYINHARASIQEIAKSKQMQTLLMREQAKAPLSQDDQEKLHEYRMLIDGYRMLKVANDLASKPRG